MVANEVLQQHAREIEVWRRLEHKHIVPFVGKMSTRPASMPALISEWMPNGELKRIQTLFATALLYVRNCERVLRTLSLPESFPVGWWNRRGIEILTSYVSRHYSACTRQSVYFRLYPSDRPWRHESGIAVRLLSQCLI
jgi:serine/threonine protein kinase